MLMMDGIRGRIRTVELELLLDNKILKYGENIAKEIIWLGKKKEEVYPRSKYTYN